MKHSTYEVLRRESVSPPLSCRSANLVGAGDKSQEGATSNTWSQIMAFNLKLKKKREEKMKSNTNEIMKPEINVLEASIVNLADSLAKSQMQNGPLAEKTCEIKTTLAKAQYELAFKYLADKVDGYHKQALSLLTESAQHGLAAAQYRLALMFLDGDVTGLKKDEAGAQAFIWLKKSAEQEHTPAQHDLASFYFLHLAPGISDAEADAQALKWCEKCVQKGHRMASFLLATLYQTHRVAGISDAEADARALDLAKNLLRSDCGFSQGFLGSLYQTGCATGMDSTEAAARAASLYQKSAQQGYIEGQNALEFMYDQNHIPTISGIALDAQQQKIQKTDSSIIAQAEPEPDWLYDKAIGLSPLSVEFFFFLLFRDSERSKSMTWFNKNPKQHLITYCNEIVKFILGEKTQLHINKHTIQEHLDFIESEGSKQLSTAARVMNIFNFNADNTEKLRTDLQYALLRVNAYISLYKDTDPDMVPFESLSTHPSFTGEDAYHLAMQYFSRADQFSSTNNTNFRESGSKSLRPYNAISPEITHDTTNKLTQNSAFGFFKLTTKGSEERLNEETPLLSGTDAGSNANIANKYSYLGNEAMKLSIEKGFLLAKEYPQQSWYGAK